MPDTIDDARRMIESRIAEIETEARQLEPALAHLVGSQGTGPRRRRARGKGTRTSTSPTPATPRKGSPQKAGKRAARGERQRQLLAAIEANPGARPSELARSIGIRPTQVSVLIAKARSEMLIVKSGKGYALKS